MVGGFPRSTLYQILHCGFFAFVSIMVLFYISLFKSILKPGSCTNKTLTGKVFVYFSPVNAWSCPTGFLSPYIEMAHIMQSLSFLFTVLPFPLYYEQPIQPLLSPQALSSGKRKDSEATTTNFKTQKKGKFRTIDQIKESKLVLKGLAFLSA